MSPVSPFAKPVETDISIRRYRLARDLVFDYALGAAIVGLNPFPNRLILTLLITGILLLKMMRDIGTLWGFQKGQGFLAIAGNFFGAIGAVSVAWMAWLFMIVGSILIPVLHRLAIPAALFTLVLIMGFATNHYYFNGYLMNQRGDHASNG